jgi:hypothetical protein
MIMKNVLQNEKLTLFLDYYIQQWCRTRMFPSIRGVSISIHQYRHRTNCAVEGWNCKINSFIGRQQLRAEKELCSVCKETRGRKCPLKVVLVGAFTELWKATLNFVLYVFLPVCLPACLLAWNNASPTGSNFVTFLVREIFSETVDKIQIC